MKVPHRRNLHLYRDSETIPKRMVSFFMTIQDGEAVKGQVRFAAGF